MANPTMTLIGTPITVGSGGAASFTLSSIPSTYTDIKVVISARVSSSATGGQLCYLVFNGSGYPTSKWLIGSGSAASSNTRSDAYILEVDSATQTASTFSNNEFYFPNYANTSYNKSFSVDSVVENNATAADSNLVAGIWASTSAITQLDIIPLSGTFVQYSTIYLYGIKNS